MRSVSIRVHLWFLLLEFPFPRISSARNFSPFPILHSLLPVHPSIPLDLSD